MKGTQMQSYINALLYISVSDLIYSDWFASAGCFFLALCWCLWVVCCLYGTNDSQYSELCACIPMKSYGAE